MESNGVKGKIHVSQETADHLASLGKGSWISPREDKIVAKGKGDFLSENGRSVHCCGDSHLIYLRSHSLQASSRHIGSLHDQQQVQLQVMYSGRNLGQIHQTTIKSILRWLYCRCPAKIMKKWNGLKQILEVLPGSLIC